MASLTEVSLCSLYVVADEEQPHCSESSIRFKKESWRSTHKCLYKEEST